MSASATKYHVPDPMDLLFFAMDYAGQRLNRPGAFIHMQMELKGRIDVAGLGRALACIHRKYPATASHLERSPILGRPRWRLNGPRPDINRIVRVHMLSPLAEDEFARRVNLLLNEAIDLDQLPPVRFHVFRGLQRGDVLVMRYPHALMDGRGGFNILQELQAFYEAETDPETVESAGDEDRRDFEELLNSPGQSLGSASCDASHGPEPQRMAPQLPACERDWDPGPMRWSVRKLDAAQCRQMGAIAKAVCPNVRFGAYLRATALEVLAPLMSPPLTPDTLYTVPYVLEGRQGSCTAPICRNLFSIERLHVPANIISDRRTVARHLHEQTAAMLSNGLLTRHLRSTVWGARFPTAVLGTMVRQSLLRPPDPHRRARTSDPPSLPMGFVRTFNEELPNLAGAQLDYTYVFRPPLMHTGMGIQVCADRGQLVMAGLAFAYREELMNTFLDRFAARLLSTEP